jgi:hypothetical protein
MDRVPSRIEMDPNHQSPITNHQSPILGAPTKHVNPKHRIGELAVEMAGRTTGKSPFADRGVKFGVNYAGGKMDDVTVVVARVSES